MTPKYTTAQEMAYITNINKYPVTIEEHQWVQLIIGLARDQAHKGEFELLYYYIREDSERETVYRTLHRLGYEVDLVAPSDDNDMFTLVLKW